MKGSQSGRVFRIGRRRQIESISIYRLLASRRLRFEPFPGRPGDEAITCEVLQGTLGHRIAVGRIEAQKLFRLPTERLGRLDLYSVHRRELRRMRDFATAFVVIPSGQQRNVALLSFGKNGGHQRGQEVPVHVGSKTGTAAVPFLQRGVENPLRRNGSHFLERRHPQRRTCKLGILLRTNGERRQGKAAAEKGCAAFADSSVE